MKVKSAVHQASEASGECSGRHPAPEFIVGGATRETSAEKNAQETHAKQSTHDPAIGQRLQIIIVGLLKTIQPVARIVTGVDDTERAQTGSQNRMIFDYVECDVPEVRASRRRIGRVNGTQQAAKNAGSADSQRAEK